MGSDTPSGSVVLVVESRILTEDIKYASEGATVRDDGTAVIAFDAADHVAGDGWERFETDVQDVEIPHREILSMSGDISK